LPRQGAYTHPPMPVRIPSTGGTALSSGRSSAGGAESGCRAWVMAPLLRQRAPVSVGQAAAARTLGAAGAGLDTGRSLSRGIPDMTKPLLAAVPLLLALLAPDAAAHQAPEPLAGLDAQVESVRETFRVPGIAVAVVKDGEVVFAGGWGQREAGRPEAVDADTLFSIASITKAFTSAALSILADE